MRQIVLDTETTGIDVVAGHRIIEVGCIELNDRRITGREIHFLVNPDRAIDEEAQAVHGIALETLLDKPRFADIAPALLGFIGEAELIIHNAPFDLGFLNRELKELGHAEKLEQRLSVIDTLKLAKTLNPGLRNSLDALCKRYSVDNSKRELHDARTDARLLAQVYLNMTGGQESLGFVSMTDSATRRGWQRQVDRTRVPAFIAEAHDLIAHEARLAALHASSKGRCRWPRDASA
jgi:DNA polymerase III subunit epsilon